MASIFDGLADIFTGALGQTVTVTPSGGEDREIMARFVNRSGDDLGIVQGGPQIHARTLDVADLRDGDAVMVDGAGYRAREFRPDGHGMTVVIMEADRG